MLDFESALARAEAKAGLMPADAAEAITAACRADAFDIGALGEAAAASGNPVVPIVRALRAMLDGPAADQVHRGATSQDVIDTAAMLVARRALDAILDDMTAASDAAATLASAHRSTLMTGRTLLQQALPTTFGLKAAGWMAGIDEAIDRLDRVRRYALAVQLGGAAGTLASLGTDGIAVLALLATELGLVEPAIPWHTERSRIAELAAALGQAAGALAKPARDVILLAQTEVGEVREGVAGRGGSSSMPHKRNPIAAVSAAACAAQAPGLVATLLGAMAHEHERAAGDWHAEWRPLSELLRSVGSAAAWLRDCLEDLEVDASRMRSNLEMTGGVLLAERVAGELAPSLGRSPADDLIESLAAEATATGNRFAEVLARDPSIAPLLDRSAIDRLLDPSGYLGSAGEFLDRALRDHSKRRGTGSE